MASHHHQRTDGLISGALLLLIAAAYTLLSLWTPFAYDDWIFMAEWNEVNGHRPLSLRTLFEFWQQIRLYDNGRIANVLDPVFTMFSPWKELFPLVTGVLSACIVAFVSYFSFGKRYLSCLLLACSWIAVLFLLPWRNALFVTDYSLNYVWAAVVTMAFMVYVMHCERHGWNLFNFINCLILAFLAGGWHEGFAVPVLGGYFLYTLKIHHFSPQWYFCGIFYAVVTGLFYICPGLIGRTSEQMGVMAIGMSYSKIVVDFFAVICLCFLIIVFALVPQLRKYLAAAWANRWFVIGIGIVFTGSVLSLLFKHQPRSAFWPALFSIVMMFILTRPVWDWLSSSSYRFYLTLLVTAVCLVPICFTTVWQYRLAKEQNVILEKMRRSFSGTVYHDIIRGSDIPTFLTLKMTNHPAWSNDFNYQALKNYNHKPYTAVVPVSLENSDNWLNAHKIEGNVGALDVGDAIILPYDVGKETSANVEVQLLDGTKTHVVAFLLPFMSPHGIPYTYVSFYNTALFSDGIDASDIKGLYL